MMRGVSTWAVGRAASPDGEIDVQSFPLVSWAKRHRAFCAGRSSAASSRSSSR